MTAFTLTPTISQDYLSSKPTLVDSRPQYLSTLSSAQFRPRELHESVEGFQKLIVFVLCDQNDCKSEAQIRPPNCLFEIQSVKLVVPNSTTAAIIQYLSKAKNIHKYGPTELVR